MERTVLHKYATEADPQLRIKPSLRHMASALIMANNKPS